jgi:hypothetical protein
VKFWLFVLGLWGMWLLGTSNTKLRYSMYYHVPFSAITIPQKPHDCEWSSAPLGEKNCSYEPEVFSVRTDRIQQSDGPHQIVSINEHQWLINDDPSVVPYVAVSWRKVNQ